MAMAPSHQEPSVPMGILISVTLAGHGVMKKAPISSTGIPVLSLAARFAIMAETSIGAFRFSTWAHRSGKRTRISRTTAGHAELITGLGSLPSAISFLVASETSSAPLETS